MRILYHHRTSANDGSVVHIEGLVTALRQLGAHVRVVAPPMAAETVGQPARGAWSGVLRQRLPRVVHELAELAYNGPESLRLERALRDFKPDLVYQRSNLFLLSGAHVAHRAGLPLIEEINAPYFTERSAHGGIALPAMARWAERRAWQSADAIITVTSVLADIVALQGVARDRVHVMPNGIDPSLLSEGAIDAEAKRRLGLADRLVFGFTGFVREWNKLDPVIDQLARPENGQWLLLIVGDGPARLSLEARARARGVQERVRFTGVVGRSELASYVSAFDIALQPAANAYASPLKLFEYMALRRAIVAPDQPNIREILTDGVDSVLFDPTDPSSLGRCLQILATDASLRKRLAAAAAGTAARRDLTWTHNADRVMTLASGLIAAKRSAAAAGPAGAQVR